MGRLQLSEQECEQARLSRDARFDGRFITGVLTTGIYCRPVCPARPAAKGNVRYFATPAAAQDAGYRPCLRCRPELAPRTPEWSVANDTLIRALRLLDAGYLDTNSVSALAAKLGVSARHLGRLFQQHLGTGPLNIARTRRVLLAKRLLDQTQLPMTAVAMHAGFGSLRSFNAQMRHAYQRSPSALRQATRQQPAALGQGDAFVLRLPVRQPYNAPWVFDFLRKRTLAGVEDVPGQCYMRLLTTHPSASGLTEETALSVGWQDNGLQLRVPPAATLPLSDVLTRVRRIFDTDADSAVIDAHLRAQPRLRALMGQTRGLRIPGAWDGFETAVRAMLGQQVSVARATQLAADMVQRYGQGQFPTPAQLAQADVAELGMPGQRGRAISELAQRVAAGEITLDEHQDSDSLSERLCEIRGVGPWTASYVALRVVRDPDAFPESDWVVMKVLGLTAAAARKEAVPWRPWRSYALMYLWHAAGKQKSTQQSSNQ